MNDGADASKAASLACIPPAPNGPATEGSAKLPAPEPCAVSSEEDGRRADAVEAAALLDGAAAFSPETAAADPGKAVWGPLTDGAETLASVGGPTACDVGAALVAAAALIKL